MDLAASESGVARMIALILLTSYTSDFAEEELDDLAADLEIHDVINSTAHSVDGQTVIRKAVPQLDVGVLVTPDDGGLLDDSVVMTGDHEIRKPFESGFGTQLL